jgi:DNA-binding NarL/FixJ family response regulator
MSSYIPDISIAKRSTKRMRYNLVKEMWERGETLATIGAATFYAPRSIKYIAQAMGCGTHQNWTRLRPATDEEKQRAQLMRKDGLHIAAIAHELGRSAATVHRWLYGRR